MEESQHLITGFANCIERAKWLQLPVVVEPPFLLKTPPHETTPILQGTASSPLHIHKKKGKKIRKARGL